MTTVFNKPNLTLSNPNINKFFEADGEAPVREFMYVHTHHIPENFMSDIEVMIKVVTEYSSEEEIKAKAGAFQKLAILATEFGSYVNDVNETTAVKILNKLKEIYVLVKRLAPEAAKALEVKQ